MAWLILAVCLVKGIKSSGKVVYFTSLFPYALLIILAGRAFTLPGATDGVLLYLTPQWTRLLDMGQRTILNETKIFLSYIMDIMILFALQPFGQTQPNKSYSASALPVGV